jgi:hypothetical protein
MASSGRILMLAAIVSVMHLRPTAYLKEKDFVVA